jgi:uncharacterized membrane protein
MPPNGPGFPETARSRLASKAIFITGVLLISQNRQNAYADKRAELDYEVNVRTYREIHEIDALLGSVIDRLARIEAAVTVRAGDGVR